MLITNGKTKTKSNIKTRICASLGLRMKFKTLFTWVTPIKQDLMHYRKNRNWNLKFKKFQIKSPRLTNFALILKEKHALKKSKLHLLVTQLFTSGEEKHGHHFDLPLFFKKSKQFLAPGGLSAECVEVRVM